MIYIIHFIELLTGYKIIVSIYSEISISYFIKFSQNVRLKINPAIVEIAIMASPKLEVSSLFLF